MINFKVFYIVLAVMTLQFSDAKGSVSDNQDVFQAANQIFERSLTQLSLVMEFDDIEAAKKQLKVMYETDHEVRGKLIKVFMDPNAGEIVSKLDRAYEPYVKKIIEIHGWPSISKFGEEAQNHVWLLVQHADSDPNFQEHCLTLMEPLMEKGEVDKTHYALLFDRVAVAKGEKQRFGTQAKIIDGEVVIDPFEGTLRELEARRQQVGLLPLEAYKEQLKRVYL